jgi:hypothetical protein
MGQERERYHDAWQKPRRHRMISYISLILKDYLHVPEIATSTITIKLAPDRPCLPQTLCFHKYDTGVRSTIVADTV